MNHYQKVAEMYRSHPLSASLRSIRHRPYFRSVLYGCLLIASVYVLYSFVNPTYPVSTYSSFSRADPFSGDLAESYLPVDETPADVWRGRAKSVKLAFLHGYHGYERYAQPHDEIRPLSNDFIDKCAFAFFTNVI